MVTFYWGLEFVKVLLAYVFLMFIWPSVVFRKYLAGRSKTFWFGFCVTVQIVLINTVVICLGLLHILNIWVFRILMFTPFVYALVRRIKWGTKEQRNLKHLITGTYGVKHFIRNVLVNIGSFIRKCIMKFRRTMKAHWWEYGLLSIILLFGLCYFSYGAFQDYSYGFGDMYPHHAWIYGLLQGKIFSAGVYPEAMHCFIYAMHVLFGVRVYSCMLFTAGIHVVIFLLSAYVLLKEVFRWHYTPMFVLAAFLTVDLLCVDEIYSMSRLQWTIPQDFGLYTQFLCAAFLVRYLKHAGWIVRKGKLTRFMWDENLFVFMMALAASLTIHFYPTIMAFFLCVSFMPVYFNKVFSRHRFVPIVAAVVSGFLIAVLPMGGALASGIEFQGSIGWAMSIIDGTDNQDLAEKQAAIDAILQSGEGGDASSTNQAVQEPKEASKEQENAVSQEVKENVPEPIKTVKEPLPERLKLLGGRLVVLAKEKAKTLFQSGYVVLYRHERAVWIVGFTFLALAIWFVSRLFMLLLKLFTKGKKGKPGYFDNYLSITIASVVFIAMYAAIALGLPPLIAGSRVCSTAQLYVLAMMAVPLDFLFTIGRLLFCEGIMKVVSALTVAGIYVGTIMTGTFHGHLYYELTRYNAAVLTTHSITEALPKGSFTVVSTTDELYQLIEYGWHEELSNFLNNSLKEDYTLPSEYIFIYVEKRPIQYAQSHFFGAANWLAWEKYTDYYGEYGSQCPAISGSEIYELTDEQRKRTFANHSGVYSKLDYRTLVESRAYEWCEEFNKLYPNELKTYYEDENFVCYYFRQNVQNLYQLGIFYDG